MTTYPLHLHFLWWESFHKVNFLDHAYPPPLVNVVCECPLGSAYGSLSFPDPCNLNYPDVESAWVLHQVELSLTVQPVVCLATHSYVLPWTCLVTTLSLGLCLLFFQSVIKCSCILDAATSSGILKAKRKLGVTFNSNKLGDIDFTKFSKLSMCSAGAGRCWLVQWPGLPPRHCSWSVLKFL